ncbi:dTDP-glucose 4,6-dehydratase [Streptomyces ureilyticus]|uniref:dTDP-glucose 4,6-dehydratase n=1 Tax=Streptomyces ureilyticus TaxID=1775131 RepID=A0ABX0DX91_9ACTN|nr:dTDP-glucose 4,6-dehydratase [Streptomyces ureilyticus]NGO46557.1 dTDP-glucose 4,6-dehydratase [Streptomyces ureilyticus]
MKILVTGGAGFIGSAYVRRLLREPGPVEVTVLDALTYAGNPDNLAEFSSDPRLSFVHGDICDAPLVRRLLPGHEHLVHFAAESHVDRSIEDSGAFTRTNVLGTQVLLDEAVRAGTAVFVHVSTDEVYGSVTEGAWDEGQPLAPNSPYAASKAAADLLALAHHRTHGLDVRVTRCSNNYGPRQYPEKIIPLFAARLLTGRDVPLYGVGAQIREWLHVDDHCLGVDLVRAEGRAGRVYHLGGGTELTNRELTARLLAACGADADRIEYVADRKGHDFRYALGWTRARTELGYRPVHDFDTGLIATVAWYRANPQWWAGRTAAT